MAFNLKHLSPIKNDYQLPQLGNEMVSESTAVNKPNFKTNSLSSDGTFKTERLSDLEMKIAGKPAASSNNQPMLSQGGNDKEDSFFTQLKTFVSNPMYGVQALGNDLRRGIRDGLGLKNDMGSDSGALSNLTQLNRSLNYQDETGDAVEELNRGKSFNAMSSLIPAAQLASTATDALSGDFTSIATKKLNKIPGFKNYVNANRAKQLYNAKGAINAVDKAI
tara:strand:+ start:1919 stop:2581 length:663 start_codon:yes stop_codon:yes gene_type:complete